jgi:hypothetical protein
LDIIINFSGRLGNNKARIDIRAQNENPKETQNSKTNENLTKRDAGIQAVICASQ